MTSPIVTSQWLNNNLNDDRLVILDASQQIAADNVVIVGARYFDIEKDFSDTANEFPNTFPSVAQFESGSQKLGIDNESKIVVYDNKGIFSSPRVWWMFKAMGHEKIVVLDGGLPDWLTNGYETEIGFDSEFDDGNFKANFKKGSMVGYDFICENSNRKNAVVIDARSEGRFSGITPEPREGLRSGHIPNSINLPYTDVLDNGKLKSIAELIEVFSEIKKETRPLVFSCGSGITACIILLASELVIEHPTSIYDGSWTEWATLQG